jgi:hypothetical protein
VIFCGEDPSTNGTTLSGPAARRLRGNDHTGTLLPEQTSRPRKQQEQTGCKADRRANRRVYSAIRAERTFRHVGAVDDHELLPDRPLLHGDGRTRFLEFRGQILEGRLEHVVLDGQRFGLGFTCPLGVTQALVVLNEPTADVLDLRLEELTRAVCDLYLASKVLIDGSVPTKPMRIASPCSTFTSMRLRMFSTTSSMGPERRSCGYRLNSWMIFSKTVRLST